MQRLGAEPPANMPREWIFVFGFAFLSLRLIGNPNQLNIISIINELRDEL